MGLFTLSGTFNLQINTGNDAIEVNGTTISGKTFLVSIANVTMNLWILEVTGSAEIKLQNGLLELSLEMTLNLFDRVRLAVSGYVNSNGEFEITGYASATINFGFVKLVGEVSITFQNDAETGFGVSGFASGTVVGGVFEIEYASATGSFAATDRGLILTITAGEITAEIVITDDPLTLATKEGTTLILNIGSRAKYRDGDEDDDESDYTEDIAETFLVSHEGLVGLTWPWPLLYPDLQIGDEIVSVQAFGFKLNYAGIRKIKVEDAGQEDDYIEIAAGVLADVEIHGGAGNDTLIASGSGVAKLSGGSGDDTISGGAGDAFIYGGSGNDELFAGDGENHIDGQSGNDLLIGSAGDNSFTIGSNWGIDRFEMEDPTVGLNTLYLESTADDASTWNFSANRLDFGSNILLVGDGAQLHISDHQARADIYGPADGLIGDVTVHLDAAEIVVHDTLAGGGFNFQSAGDIQLNGDLWVGRSISLNTGSVRDLSGLIRLNSAGGQLVINEGRSFSAPDGNLIVAANALTGVIQSDVAGLSATVSESGDYSDIIVREADDLEIIGDGIDTPDGIIDIALAEPGSVFTHAAGIIRSNAPGQAISITADDMDFAAGESSIVGLGELKLNSIGSGINFRIGRVAESEGIDRTELESDTWIDLSYRDTLAIADGFTRVPFILEHSESAVIFGDSVILSDIDVRADAIQFVEGELMLGGYDAIFRALAINQSAEYATDGVVSAGRIEMEALSGGIVATIESTAFAAQAQGDIEIVQVYGDLNLVEPEAWSDPQASVHSLAGDVVLRTLDGSIVDQWSEDEPVLDPADLAMAPGVLTALYPHAELSDNPTLILPEMPNVLGVNVTLSTAGDSAQIGRLNELVAVERPGNFEGYSAELKQFLAQAIAGDVVGVTHQLYQYTGDAGRINLDDPQQFADESRWSRINIDRRTGTDLAEPHVTSLQQGMTVLVEFSAEQYGLYQYLGDSAPVNLSSQNYANHSNWRPIIANWTTSDGIVDLQSNQIVANQYFVEGALLANWQDFNAEATGAGTLTIDSAGSVVVESVNSFSVGSIRSDQDIRLKSGQGIFAAQADSGAHITGRRIDLAALQGSIGTDASPLQVDVLPNGFLSAQAAGDLDLIQDQGDFILGQMSSFGGDVGLSTLNGSILDGIGSEINIRGNSTTLSAIGGSIGNNDDRIETRINLLEAQADERIIALINQGDLTIRNGGVSLAVAGAIMLSASESLTIDTDLTMGAGISIIRLEAEQGDLILNGVVATTPNPTSSATGSVMTLIAQGNVLQQSGELRNVNGSIDVQAIRGSIIQADGTRMTTGSAIGDIRLDAWEDIRVAALVAGTGSVALLAQTGAVIDNGDSHVDDVLADGLLIQAAQRVDHLETNVAVLSVALPAGNLDLIEKDDLVVGEVDVSIVRASRLLEFPDVSIAQSDLSILGDGSIVLRTLNGSITVQDGVTSANNSGIRADGAGHILLHAQGSGSSITLQSAVNPGTGVLSLLAGNNVVLSNATQVVTAGVSVDIEAQLGSIQMGAGTAITTGGGNVRLWANDTIQLTHVSTGSGSIGLTAQSGSMVDANGTAPNLQGVNLGLFAGNGIGSSGDALEIAVEVLAAQAGSGGIHLLEQDAINLASVDGVAVARVRVDASTTVVQDAIQSDLLAINDGSITLRTVDGSITLQDGAAPYGTAVSALGTGSILLDAQGDAADLIIDAGIAAQAGSITLGASGALYQGEGTRISTEGGSITVEARSGALTQAASAEIVSVGGDVGLQASSDITLSSIVTGPFLTTQAEVLDLAGGTVTSTGSVTVIAGGQIAATSSNIAHAVSLIADLLTIHAQAGIVDLSIAANRLDAQAGIGNIILTDRDGLAQTNPGLLVTQAIASQGNVVIRSDGNLRVESIQVQNDVRLTSEAGSIEIIEPLTGAAIEGISGAEIGEIRLSAAEDISTDTFIQGVNHTEYVAGGALLLPAGSVGVVTSNSLILHTVEALRFDAVLNGVTDVQLRSDTAIDYSGELVAVGSFFAQASADNVLVADPADLGTVRIDVVDLDVTNLQLRASNAVDLIRSATSDYEFAGVIGGLSDGDLLAQARIETAGNFAYTVGAGDRIDTEQLIIEADGTLDIDSPSAGLSFAGGSLTAAEGGQIKLTAAEAIDLGTMTLQALNGTVVLRSTNAAVTMGNLGLVDASLLEVTAVGSIEVSSKVDRIQATLSGAGVVIIQEFDAIELVVNAPDATVLVIAGGTITVTDVTADELLLAALQGDILVNLAVVTNAARMGAANGQIREVEAFDSDSDLIAASANLRASQVILNSDSYAWADNQVDLGIELTVPVVDNLLDPSLILGDVIVNDALVAELNLQAGDALDLTATGTVTIETLTALIPLAMTIGSWGGILINGSLPSINVRLESRRNIRVKNGRQLQTTGNLSLLAAGSILQEDGAAVEVDVGGSLSLASIEQGTIAINSLGSGVLTVDTITLGESALTLTAANGLTIGQMTSTASSANTVTLTTTSGDMVLGAMDAGSRSTISLNSAAAVDQVDANSVVKARALNVTAVGKVTLNTELELISVENTSEIGAILISETSAGGDLSVTQITQALNNSGQIRVVLSDGSLTLLPVETGSTVFGQGLVHLEANGDTSVIEIRGPPVTAGDMVLVAGGYILGNVANEVDLQANHLNIRVGTHVGMTADPLWVQVNSLEVSANGTIAIQDQGDLSIVGSGIRTVDTGAILLSATNSITVNSSIGSDTVDGIINVEAERGVLTLAADVSAVFGNVRLVAGQGIVHSPTSVETNVAAQQIVLEVDSGNIGSAANPLYIDLLNDGALSASLASDLFVAERSGDLRIDQIETSGTIYLETLNGSIVGEASTTSNVIASTLNLVSTGAVGQAGNLLQTRVEDLNVELAGALLLFNQGDLVVDTVNQGGSDGLVRIEAAQGKLTLAGNFQANAPVSLQADGDIVQLATSTLSNNGASIDLHSLNGGIDQQDGARIYTFNRADANLRLEAAYDINVSHVGAGDASIALISRFGSIIDAGDTDLDLVGGGLLIQVSENIGSRADKLEVSIDQLSAQTVNGGVYLTEADTVTVDEVSVWVDRVSVEGMLLQTEDRSSGVSALGSGDVELASLGGSIRLIDDISTVSGELFLSVADQVILEGSANLISSAEVIHVEAPNGVVADALHFSNSPGVFSVDGNQSFGANEGLVIQIGGLVPASAAFGKYDQLLVSGTANLGGTLAIVLVDEFAPQLGDVFDIITADSIQGSFDLGKGLYGFGDGSLYFEVIEHASGLRLEVKVRVAAELIDIDTYSAADDDALGMFFNPGHFGFRTYEASATLQVAEFFYVSGTYVLQNSAEEVTLSDGSVESTLLWRIGGNGLEGFVGVNGPAANEAALGFAISGIRFGLGFYRELDGDRSWGSVKAFVDDITPVGFVDAIQISARDVAIDLNVGSDATTVIAYDNAPMTVQTGADDVIFDFIGEDETLLRVTGYFKLAVFDFFFVEGWLGFEKSSEWVELADGTVVNTDMLTVGGTQLNAFVGINGPYRTDSNGNEVIDEQDARNEAAMGLSLGGVEFGLALMSAKSGQFGLEGMKWLALEASAEAVEAVGIPGITIAVRDLAVAINRVEGVADGVDADDRVINFKADPLEVATGTGLSMPLTMDGAKGELTRVTGDMELNFYGFFYLGGSLGLEKSRQYVQLADGTEVDTDLLTIGGTGLQAFAGVNGPYLIDGTPNPDAMGLVLADVEFAVALMTPKPGQVELAEVKWVGLEAVAGIIDFVGLPESDISFDIRDISVAINRVEGLADGVDPRHQSR